MLWWIPTGLAITSAIIFIILTFKEADTDFLFGILITGIAWAVVIGICSLVTAGIASTAGERDYWSADLKPFEGGHYIESYLADGDLYLVFNQVIDGQTIPQTVINGQEHEDGWLYVVEQDDKFKYEPRIVQRQHYLVNEWLWPWPWEGGSYLELQVAESSVILK